MARPRDAQIDRAVSAAVHLLLTRSGYESLSMSAVAEQAQVSRAALYRRWPNKAALCFDVVFGPVQRRADEHADWRSELTDTVQLLSRGFASEAAQRATPGLLSAYAEDAALGARVRHELLEPGYGAIQHQLDRGRAAGALGQFDDLLFIDMLFGAVFVRAGVFGRPLDDAGAALMVRLLLEGVQHDEQRTGAAV